MPTHRPTPHLGWEQLSCIPRELITAELTWHIDARRNRIQVAWRLRETDTDAVVGMEVGAERDDAWQTLTVTRAAKQLHERALDAIQPF